MKRLFAILSVVLLSSTYVVVGLRINPESTPAASAVSAAHSLYGAATNLTVYDATDSQFEAAFANYDLYLVVENETALRHVMAYKDSDTFFDITSEFSDLMADALSPLVVADDATKLAKAFAQTGNAELDTTRKIVYAADSNWIGQTIADPAAVFLVGSGWQVTLWAWSQENGILANWTFRFGLANLTRAEWWVNATATGSFDANIHAVGLRAGLQVINRYGASGHNLTAYWHEDGGVTQARVLYLATNFLNTLITTRENWDGSVWKIYYNSSVDEPIPDLVETRAILIANASKQAYDKLAVGNWNCVSSADPPDPNWLFYEPDPGCELAVFVSPREALGSPVATANTARTKIHVNVLFKETVNAFGYWVTAAGSLENVTNVTMQHELFHRLQYYFTGQPADTWSNHNEGMARMSETLAYPNESQDSTSYFFGDANRYMLQTTKDFCAYSSSSNGYQEALYWGFLYQRDGGLPLFKSILKNLTNQTKPVGSGCNYRLAENISNSIVSLSGNHSVEGGGNHSSHAYARSDFALYLYTRNFTWGSPNLSNEQSWASHLNPPTESIQLLANSTYLDIGPWAIKYVNLTSVATPYTLHCAAGDGNWNFTVIRRDLNWQPSRTNVNCTTGVAITPSEWSSVAFTAVRTFPLSGTFQLEVLL